NDGFVKTGVFAIGFMTPRPNHGLCSKRSRSLVPGLSRPFGSNMPAETSRLNAASDSLPKSLALPPGGIKELFVKSVSGLKTIREIEGMAFVGSSIRNDS